MCCFYQLEPNILSRSSFSTVPQICEIVHYSTIFLPTSAAMVEAVLIVGAGPVGLTAAVELWRQGVPARIINKTSDFAAESRAIGINPVSLTLLEASGVTEQLLSEGTKIERSYMHFQHGGIATIDFRKIENKYRFILALPQSRTERILNNALEALGGHVEHDTVLEHLEQEGDVVHCHVTSASGPAVIDARTVIGADGAHSICRKSIGVAFPGDAIDGDWSLADVRMEWQTHEAMEEHLPPGATVTEEIWRSKFSVHHRQATTYQVGRVFLAGDAAHVHSPVGGRGMNLGIKDAVTLVRLMMQGREAEYTETCYPDGAKTVAAVRRQTMAISSSVWWQKRLMGILMPLILKVPPIHRMLLSFVSSLD
eukprot:IDg5163t1